MSVFVHRRLKASAFAFAAGVLLAASAAHAQTTLRYSPWLPAKYPLNDAVLKPWMTEVEKVTEGRVKFDWLPKAVGTAPAQFDTVRDGLADLSLVLPGYTPGRFELIELGELPLLSSDVSKLGPIFYKLYAQHLEPLKPFAGTHVLSIWATIPTHVVSGKGIIRQLDDFKGLKLRAPSATAVAVMKQVNAVPVQKPVSEIYELASTGIIDGSFFPISTTYDFKVDKALKYMTLIPGGLGQSVMALLVNESKWKKILEKDRTAIMALSGEKMAGAAGVLFGKAEADAIAKAKAERPDEVAVAGTALMKDLTKSLEPVDEDWFKKAKAKKLSNPEKVLESFRAELAK